MSLTSHDAGDPSPLKKEINNSNVAQPRQIRFISNDGQPHAKRRRINAACRTCRKRKTRCEGSRPICRTCSDNGHACLGYTEPAQHQRTRSTDQPSGREDDEESHSSHSRSATRSPSRMRKSDEASQKPGLDQQSSIESSTSLKSASPHRGGMFSIKENDQMSESRSPASNQTSLSMSTRNRVPYFRYFGPTAIVPGFKQMVVQVKEPRISNLSLSAESPASTFAGLQGTGTSAFGATPSASGTESRTTIEIPFYDATEPLPNSLVITHLCETFFTHLGCNFPFLQRERFLRDLAEKRVDAILVDAVCCIAARFSTHPLLSTPNPSFGEPLEAASANEVQKPAYGQPFAHRAMSAVVDTFSCPTMAVAQACLLLAYEEFGANHDSGLWMYLGLAIRMAQDLGMQKLEGLRYEGRIGPTPKTSKSGHAGKLEEKKREEEQRLSKKSSDAETASVEDSKASERERIDTFWSIFFLDRVVSSGTGRPVTLRDKDIEISFPSQLESEWIDGWPAPFPPLIRIIYLYGRVTDLLNAIKEVNHVTPETLKRLAGMESDLTGIYQRLSPKLHFNVINFQHYVKAEQGTNFILLHFWFHTLIVLLHQPTLLHSFEGRIQQLFPNSRELSMSSAKTIADILAFAELIDAKSFVGNPFTSQPMYIAACAFLAEAAAHTEASQPPSRDASPLPRGYPASKKTTTKTSTPAYHGKASQIADVKAQKHTLLASAAQQNYQACYKALKSLETYWAGTKYIVTVLDQKAKGIGDPLLYTTEEMDSAVEMPRTEPAFTTPGWRRSMAHSASMGATANYANNYPKLRHSGDLKWENPGSPMIDPSQAIGWSLTGTTNSPNPNLSFLYQTTNGEFGGPISPQHNPQSQYNLAFQSLPLETANATANAAVNASRSSYPQYATAAPPSHSHHQTLSPMPPPMPKYSPIPSDSISTSDADLLLGLHSPYSSSASRPTPGAHTTFDEAPPPLSNPSTATAYNYPPPPTSNQVEGYMPNTTPGASFGHHFGDMMMIESQDIDMTAPQGHGGLPLPLGGDLIPWLEYLPQDVLSFFGEPHGGGETLVQQPEGPGPPPPPPPQ